MSWKPCARRPVNLTVSNEPVAHRGRVFWLWGTNAYSTRGSTVYDPTADAWSSLTSPKMDREHVFAVSAGDELLVWGTGGGQRLGANRRWRPMSTAKQPGARRYARHAWSGRELIVWGGSTGHRGVMNGSAYDPARDTWRKLPSKGAPPSHNGVVMWSGSELWVWGGQVWGRSLGQSTEIYEGRAYDPVADHWRSLAKLPGRDADGAVAMISGVALSVNRNGAETEAWRYESSADLWEPCAPPPLDAPRNPRLIAGDDRIAVIHKHEVLEYLVKRDVWRRLASLPAAASSDLHVLWLDDTLYAFARSGEVWCAA